MPYVDTLSVSGRNLNLRFRRTHEHEEVPEDVLAQLIEAEVHAEPASTTGVARQATLVWWSPSWSRFFDWSAGSTSQPPFASQAFASSTEPK